MLTASGSLWQTHGAGLFVPSGGVANLEGCNIYKNIASYVRVRFLNIP